MTRSADSLKTLFLVAALTVSTLATPAFADQVDLSDGRSFQGKVLTDNDQIVRIDAMVIGIRTKISFPRSEVAKVTTAPLPADFFNAVPDQQPVQVVTGQNLYLDIPVNGIIGKDIYADGILRALNYAKSHGCKAVVFEINSTGGSVEEANKILEVLRSAQGDLQYFALVQNAVGEALPIALNAQRLFVYPNAKLGGTSEDFKSFADGSTPELQSILRTQLANQAGASADSNYRYPRLVKAMIDPAEADAAWIDDQGAIEVGLTLPAGVPKNRVIFQSSGKDDKRVLTLSHDQLKELGVETYNGTSDQLGAKLAAKGWKRESDYGAVAMSTTAKYLNAQTADDAKRHKQLIKNNIDRRNQLNAYIKHNLQQAASWDPNKGSYQNYAGGWYSSPLMTNDSRANWKVRTDNASNYILQAQSAILQMKQLDAEAKRLGLDPTYPDGQLDQMAQDLAVKQDYLAGFRNKNGL
jgi:hypothetical protein